MWCGLGVEKVEPPVSKFKNWMREEFILNIYKNDEWAPLWAAEDKAQRVHAMMVYSYKLQWHLNVACRGVKIGDFWLKQGKLKNSHKGRVVRKFRTREGWCASFAHLKGVCEIFAQGKMVCEIFAYLWFSKTESMQFLKSGAKANSHRVSGVRNFRTPQGGVRISHRALFTRANAKLDSFKWP